MGYPSDMFNPKSFEDSKTQEKVFDNPEDNFGYQIPEEFTKLPGEDTYITLLANTMGGPYSNYLKQQNEKEIQKQEEKEKAKIEETKQQVCELIQKQLDEIKSADNDPKMLIKIKDKITELTDKYDKSKQQFDMFWGFDTEVEEL